MKYASFDEAVAIVQELGQCCLLGKSDLKNAFRLLPVAVRDFDQLDFKFYNKYHFDKPLPFGCSIIFENFAAFLEFAVHRQPPVGQLLHYLDDFLFGGKGKTQDCQIIMGYFQKCMSELAVPIAGEKTEGPTTVLCFLGLELDSNEMVIHLPMEKALKIIQKIQAVLSKRKVTVKAMQSLIDVLQCAYRAIIIPGCPFCRRLIISTCGILNPYYHIHVTQNIK